jgi:hypothetical protein
MAGGFGSTPASGFTAGIDDLFIIPLVAIAFAIARLLRWLFSFLVRLIDWLFPILLQVMRFPLFTLRILGDGLAFLLKGAAWVLPVGGIRRAAWREFVSRQWAWLRQKISYKVFEEWLHHAFENGMAWVFRKCKALTPRAALMVLVGALLWLPISFGTATAMHAILFAKALTWPAWMQLLHPFATVIAKSKLLVLPVYPAAWPQAKRHPFVQTMIRFWRWLGTLDLVRKTRYRYRQTEHAANIAGDALAHASFVVGLTQLWILLVTGFNAVVAWISHALRVAATHMVDLLSKAPVIGGVVQRYVDHYDAVSRQPSEPFSERVGDFYARWSVKFTAEYYEAKEQSEGSRVT